MGDGGRRPSSLSGRRRRRPDLIWATRDVAQICVAPICGGRRPGSVAPICGVRRSRGVARQEEAGEEEAGAGGGGRRGGVDGGWGRLGRGMVWVFVEKQKVNENLTKNESVGELEQIDNNEGEEEHSVKQPSIDNKQSSDDGDEQSVGEDSDFSDRLVDSEFELSDDDMMFDSNINPDLGWRTKKRIEKMGCGTDVEQYAILWSYAKQIRNSNPGVGVGSGNESSDSSGRVPELSGMAIKDILWRAARATRMADFERAMNDMRTRNTTAFEWLMQRPTTHWSNSHFSTHCKSDLLLNNMSESFNHMVLRARSKHIVDMLEIVRLILMKRVHMRRDQMMKHNGQEKEDTHVRKGTRCHQSTIVTRSTLRGNIVTSPTRVTRSSTMTSPIRVTWVNAMKKFEKPTKVNFVPPRLTRSTANPIVEDKDKATQKGKAKIIENPRKKLEVRKNLLVHTKGKSVTTEPTQATTNEGIDCMILTQSSINNSLLRPLWRPTGNYISNSIRFSMLKGFDKVATKSEE
ncbi:hypothetical protein Sango_0664600 [Sesamum angolense]|uniref:Uncharacterized protein n=1 Tax=Sesamum angolense TaxID=2727404 RepID=A0AAE2C2F3_9LAMI|nr:hypothetical protein Sango_0664600 [Sesamum angolense]